jgi:hypothetical protein
MYVLNFFSHKVVDIFFIQVKANFDTTTKQLEFSYKDKDTLKQEVLNVIVHMYYKTGVNIL